VLLLVLTLIFCSFCGCNDFNTVKTNSDAAEKKLNVVATLFPQYDFARQILKDKANVTLLLPPGTESHMYDPTPNDISKIYSSDVFLYTGKDMEPWSEKIISGIKNNGFKILNISDGIDLKKEKHNHKESTQQKKKEHHNHRYDPHVWLDPSIALNIVENILKVLCKEDPENKEFFEENAKFLKDEIKNLERDFEDLVASSKKKIVFVGNFAHLYFVDRFNLEYETAFDGCSQGSEPSVKKISKIINFIKENEIGAVYYDGSVPNKVAESIANQTGVKLLRFSSCHNFTKEQINKVNEVTYIKIMRENLENLKVGL
jgi:zinc transport system substrate-binding protein